MNEAATLLAATNTLLTLLNTIGNLTVQATQVSSMIKQANSEGRDKFTDAEWLVITGADDLARQRLVDAISKALSVQPV